MGYVIIILLSLVGLLSAIYFGFKWLALLSLFVLFTTPFSIYSYLEWRKIALARGKPNICKFARSFDYRKVDTKVMRVVYETVQQWMGNYNKMPFPVEADDNFDDFYAILPEDLDDMFKEISKKLNRSITDTGSNPYWGNVKTVRDLVMFIHHQPKLT